jgi:hypothetical protein
MRGARITVLGVALALGWATGAAGATYEVTKRSDPAPGPCTPADCTLREAVIAANNSLGIADRIVLPSRRTYELTIEDALTGAESGDLDVTNDRLRIVHPGRGRAKIDQLATDRVFDVATGAPLALTKIEVTGGNDPSEGGYGGGIRTLADLKLTRSAVTRNTSSSCGGGIHTQTGADLILKRTRVTGNRASGDGGGISASCFGGGGALTMVRSVVSGNRSDANSDGIGRGGAMYFQTGDVQSQITASTFAGNRTGPGGHPTGASEGGGIYADLGRLRITGTTLSGNRSGDNGGGISVDGIDQLAIVNSTIAGNRANSGGGGLSGESGAISLNAVTVARNLGNADGILSEAGGGIANDSADLRVENSLIALNRLTQIGGGGTLRNDCSAPDDPGIDSLGHNLISTRFLCDFFDGPGDRSRRNPKIGPLARNGGPTQTIALKRGSPAIGAAKRASAPARDQRGQRRDRQPDIGAFER